MKRLMTKLAEVSVEAELRLSHQPQRIPNAASASTRTVAVNVAMTVSSRSPRGVTAQDWRRPCSRTGHRLGDCLLVIL